MNLLNNLRIHAYHLRVDHFLNVELLETVHHVRAFQITRVHHPIVDRNVLATVNVQAIKLV